MSLFYCCQIIFKCLVYLRNTQHLHMSQGLTIDAIAPIRFVTTHAKKPTLLFYAFCHCNAAKLITFTNHSKYLIPWHELSWHTNAFLHGCTQLSSCFHCVAQQGGRFCIPVLIVLAVVYLNRKCSEMEKLMGIVHL